MSWRAARSRDGSDETCSVICGLCVTFCKMRTDIRRTDDEVRWSCYYSSDHISQKSFLLISHYAINFQYISRQNTPVFKNVIIQNKYIDWYILLFSCRCTRAYQNDRCLTWKTHQMSEKNVCFCASFCSRYYSGNKRDKKKPSKRRLSKQKAVRNSIH